MRDELLALMSDIRADESSALGVGADGAGGDNGLRATGSGGGGAGLDRVSTGSLSGRAANVDRMLSWQFTALRGELQVGHDPTAASSIGTFGMP
jgi:hypothetical protein